MKCEHCNGKGMVWFIPPHKTYPCWEIECPKCKGTGKVVKERGNENGKKIYIG